MAKATANCTCAECGSEFTKTKTCYNRTEANNWEEWAESTYTQCPSCWGKEQRQKEAEQPPTLTVGILPFQKEKPVALIWAGGTIPVKEEIKELGYTWGETPSTGFLGALDMKQPKKAWHKFIEPEEIEEEIKKAGMITGAIIKNTITGVDLISYQQMKNKRTKEEQEQQEKEKELLSELGDKPKKPSCFPKGKWNGKIYGSAKYGYSVYIDGNKTEITKEERQEIEKYLEESSEYRKKYDEGMRKIKKEQFV